MTPAASSGDWGRRAGRLGRCVARFRLASKPRAANWHTERVTTTGARCVGCDDPFEAGELHVEVVIGQTVVLELHDECFDVWQRFAQGGAQRAAPDPGYADDEEDDV
jgi:hypothetical protein